MDSSGVNIIIFIMFLTFLTIILSFMYGHAVDKKRKQEKLDKKQEEESFQKYKQNNNIPDDANVFFLY